MPLRDPAGSAARWRSSPIRTFTTCQPCEAYRVSAIYVPPALPAAAVSIWAQPTIPRRCGPGCCPARPGQERRGPRSFGACLSRRPISHGCSQHLGIAHCATSGQGRGELRAFQPRQSSLTQPSPPGPDQYGTRCWTGRPGRGLGLTARKRCAAAGTRTPRCAASQPAIRCGCSSGWIDVKVSYLEAPAGSTRSLALSMPILSRYLRRKIY